MAQDLRAARRAEHTVARWTTCLLVACLLLEAGTLASTYSRRAEVAVAAGEPEFAGVPAANDARHPPIAQIELAALVCTGILWLVWLRRAYGNLALVGSKRSRFTLGQAVGYWFIPLVNLVLAYQVMKDLWLRSDSLNDRDGYDRLPAPAYLTGWWGLSVTRAVLGVPITLMARDARTQVDLINATDVALLGGAIGIVATVLAIRVVQGIDQRQQCFSADPPDLPAPSSVARRQEATTPRLVATPRRAVVPAPSGPDGRRV